MVTKKFNELVIKRNYNKYFPNQKLRLIISPDWSTMVMKAYTDQIHLWILNYTKGNKINSKT